jgi:biotin carboxyl carrier protein
VTVEIELDGERRQVRLRRDGDRWIAEIDGRPVEVSMAETGGRWSALVAASVDLPPDGGRYGWKSYEIAFERTAKGELLVHVNGVAIPMTIVNEPGQRLAGAARRRGRDAGAGPRTIVAPMPGRIVKVLVKPDETVFAGQPLVVVEAMKMENELRAPRAGAVAEVRVREGSSVEANAVLVVLR